MKKFVLKWWAGENKVMHLVALVFGTATMAIGSNAVIFGIGLLAVFGAIYGMVRSTQSS